MGVLRCLDGSRLDVIPVPVRDRCGTPYEVTLELRLDGRPFGAVGERCGYFLALLAAGLAAARGADPAQRRAWPDADDRFPDPCPDPDAGPDARAHGADGRRRAAREPELFAFRHRERADRHGHGELRCTVRTSCTWTAAPGGCGGQWRCARRAVLEAWGTDGRGVRAVLTSAELAGFLTDVVTEAHQVGADYRDVLPSSPVSTPHVPARAIIDC